MPDDTIDPVTGLPKVPAATSPVGGTAPVTVPPAPTGAPVPASDQTVEQVNPEQSAPVELPKEETPGTGTPPPVPTPIV